MLTRRGVYDIGLRFVDFIRTLPSGIAAGQNGAVMPVPPTDTTLADVAQW